ncbi:hypothetical protein OG216_09960 [Streptomycetaceae bacterium NBC_01309]
MTTTIPDPHVYPEVFAVLVQHEGRATVIDGAVFDSREVADRVAANVAELHPDVRVVRLPVLSTPATWHGLPIVDQVVVTAALGKTVVGAALATSVAEAARCDNCHGPGPLVPHVHGMRVCQKCFPEPDAFASAAESARAAAETGGAGRG